MDDEIVDTLKNADRETINILNKVSDTYHNAQNKEKEPLRKLLLKYIIMNPNDSSNEDLEAINDFIDWAVLQSPHDF